MFINKSPKTGYFGTFSKILSFILKGGIKDFLFYLIVISKRVPAHLKKIESKSLLFKEDISS